MTSPALIAKEGDILLIKTNHFVSRLIRFGQRGYGREAASWNHCGVCIGNFEIVEALTGGVVRSPIDKYPTADVRVLKAISFPDDGKFTTAGDMSMRANSIAFALSCIGEKYGYATIAAIALKVLCRGKWNFGVQGTSICSGLAARCLERLGYNFQPYDPSELTPAYLFTVLS
jgi:uncharacterized protein YycO